MCYYEHLNSKNLPDNTIQVSYLMLDSRATATFGETAVTNLKQNYK